MLEQVEEEISLKEVLNKALDWIVYFKSKWIIILCIGVIGGVAGFVYAYSIPVLYNATLTFATEDEKSPTGGLSGLASQFGFDLGTNAGGAFSGNNLNELFKSRNMIERTLLDTITLHDKTISLAEYYMDIQQMRKNPLLAHVSFTINSKRDKFTRLQDSVLGILYEGIVNSSLSVGLADKKSTVTSISVNSIDERFSKLFIESLTREVSDFYITSKSMKAKMNLDLLQRQADSVRMELDNAIHGVAAANDNTFNLNPAMNVSKVPSTRGQIDVQSNSAVFAELVKNLELAKVTLRKETPLIQVIDSPILPLKKIRVSKLKSLILGGLVGGFIGIVFLTFKRMRRYRLKNKIS